MTAARPRVIGLLGGMSWESTAEYYRLVNELVAARLGGLHSARLVMASVDFAEIEALQARAGWARAGELLAAEAVGLQGAGAELLVLCTNTMHIVAPRIEAAIDIPLLHLADVTAAAAARADVSTAGLLGTAFVMEQPFYRDRLAGHGLDVLVPPAGDRAEVHRVIYEELCLGVIRDESRRRLAGVIERLVDAGADGIVLGCTELELLLGGRDASVPVLPTTRLHAEAAVDAALAPAPTAR